METNTKNSSSLDWIIFAVSFVITAGLLFTIPEWFWVPLPFVLTYFVKAMDWM